MVNRHDHSMSSRCNPYHPGLPYPYKHGLLLSNPALVPLAKLRRGEIEGGGERLCTFTTKSLKSMICLTRMVYVPSLISS